MLHVTVFRVVMTLVMSFCSLDCLSLFDKFSLFSSIEIKSNKLMSLNMPMYVTLTHCSHASHAILGGVKGMRHFA